jgi:hypothetical protein
MILNSKNTYMPHTNKNYWFKPLRFWGVFAFYYPASSRGWLATALLLTAITKLGIFVYFSTYSVLEKWAVFLPWLLFSMVLYDLLCFRFGQYPNWWKRKK